MVINQGRYSCALFPSFGISNALDGSEDHLASDDNPGVDGENEDDAQSNTDAEELSGDDSNVVDMGDPFSEDEADNPFSDGEQ